jgi:hypothetical protein
MNAVYRLPERLELSRRWGEEILRGGELNNKQLPGYFNAPNVAWSPRVLKDGSDSVGALGALNRVYLNIGLFSEEWLTHFIPFFGGKPISAIEISVAEKNSVYWQATELGTPDMAVFLSSAGQPDLLKDAPGGKAFMTADASVVARGKMVFADTCARCHSSKLPSSAKGLDPTGCAGPEYLDCWKKYWAWTQTDDFKAQMRQIVSAPDFVDHNYMSSDAWVPVTLLRTNICSPLATNAIAKNIWNDFSSSTYKALPSVGKVTVQDPFTGETSPYPMPAGGRGYTRVPSLISIWSTAPFLQNNRLGPFSEDPSVKARMGVFQASIEQLLWPEKRPKEPPLDGVVDRISTESWIKVPVADLPTGGKRFLGSSLNRWIPYREDANGNVAVDSTGHVEIGPIPPGTPVGLLANLQPLAETDSFSDRVSHSWKVLSLVRAFKGNIKAFKGDVKSGVAEKQRDDKQFVDMAKPLEALSKCPDYVVNRGHYFGTAEFNDTADLTDDEKSFGTEPVLSEDDKKALIEFLKTL